MNKIKYLYIIIFSILILFLLLFLINNFKVKYETKTENKMKNSNESYLFSVVEMNNCTNWKKIYYIDEDNRNYYLYCLEDLLVNVNKNYISLNIALKNKNITLEKVLNYLTERNWYNDGGTILYKDDGEKKYSLEGFSVINCNAINKIGSDNIYNKNIYIGPISMNYEKSFCSK